LPEIKFTKLMTMQGLVFKQQLGHPIIQQLDIITKKYQTTHKIFHTKYKTYNFYLM